MSDPLYQEYILDLYRHPHNKQALAAFDIKRHEKNPLCSDEIDLFLKFGPEGEVTGVGYIGDGCAISQAATSLLTDFIKKKNKQEILGITKDKMLEILGLPNISPARIGCATLGLKALHNGLTHGS